MAPKRSIASIQVHASSSSSKKKRSCRIDTACLEGTDEPLVAPRLSTSSSNETRKVVAPTAAAMQDSTRIAVLVPFRDMHRTQQRRAHLDEFVPYMTDFLRRHCGATSATFHIFILEQSLDGCKFNRGKLLNAGFDMACNDYDVYIFHDVDLLPADDLKEWYTTEPHAGPVHIARVWDRYSESSSYFGGIVAFTREQFTKVNGFPNNFWGWGGEDDELYCRVVRRHFTVQKPTSGTVRDLEEMNLQEKLAVLRTNKWKCRVKRELLKEHHRTWKKNGLNSLQYEYIDAEALHEYCTKITVNLGPNGHWSDSKSTLEHPVVAPVPAFALSEVSRTTTKSSKLK